MGNERVFKRAQTALVWACGKMDEERAAVNLKLMIQTIADRERAEKKLWKKHAGKRIKISISKSFDEAKIPTSTSSF